MIKEPLIPKNGKCIVCKTKELAPIKGPGSGGEDAFCSTTCCRIYFGTEDRLIQEGVRVS